MSHDPPEPAAEGKRGCSIWATLFLVGGVTLLIAAVVAPGLMRARIASNETTAIGKLRMLSTTQAQFQSAGIVDQDGDGEGEFGFLGEVLGRIEPRGRAQRPVPTWRVDNAFRFRGNDGIAEANGFYYLVYLPTAAGPATADPGVALAPHPDNADVQETRFVCYAWPASLGSTANRAFVISQQGQEFATRNRHAQDYEGRRKVPPPEAAYVRGPTENSKNLEGQFITGTAAGDGELWLPGCNE